MKTTIHGLPKDNICIKMAWKGISERDISDEIKYEVNLALTHYPCMFLYDEVRDEFRNQVVNGLSWFGFWLRWSELDGIDFNVAESFYYNEMTN